MPKTIDKAPRAQTPFRERNGDNSHTLGNARWARVPYFPTRERTQEIVEDRERKEASRIFAEFCENQKLAADNDIAERTAKLSQLEQSRISQDAIQAQSLRKDLEKCSHETFLKAQARVTQLIEQAAELVMPILDRAIESYDDELNALALQLEANMERLQFPLFTEQKNGATMLFKDGRGPALIKVWDLWNNRECTLLHSCREVVRNLRQKFDFERGYTLVETKRARAIPTMLFLCSAEEVNFSWL